MTSNNFNIKGENNSTIKCLIKLIIKHFQNRIFN